MERLLTSQDVADVLGVSADTACQYFKMGLLAAANYNGRWRVRPEDLDAFVQRSVTTKAPPWMYRSAEHLLRAKPLEPHYEPVVEGR